jgi:hypothetical protein
MFSKSYILHNTMNVITTTNISFREKFSLQIFIKKNFFNILREYYSHIPSNTFGGVEKSQFCLEGKRIKY